MVKGIKDSDLDLTENHVLIVELNLPTHLILLN